MWRRIAPRVKTLMIAAQLEAARGTQDYVSAQLTLQGITPDPVGVVPARAFAGIASDGRDLDTLLSYPIFEVGAFVREGMPAAQALDIGERHLNRIAVTQVADAARVSTGVAITSDRTTTGYVRMLTPPSCSRCVILAGKWCRWNAGFERHPQDDCIQIPASENIAGDLTTSPTAYFDSLSEDEQNTTFTRAGAEAVRDGADLSRVVNARRGMYSASGRKLTRERAGKRVRPMPEQIYVDANGDRDEALRLLKRFGFIL